VSWLIGVHEQLAAETGGQVDLSISVDLAISVTVTSTSNELYDL
jgi:hypothetical protein